MKLYREVPVSERLPKKIGVYFVFMQDGFMDSSAFNGARFIFNKQDFDAVVAWLEVVGLPTEEEVKRTAYEFYKFQQKSSIMDDDAYSFRKGVNWLKERLGL